MSNDWQPKIRKSEIVLYAGMAVFAICALVEILGIKPKEFGYESTPVPWLLITGVAAGLVCFIIAMRSTD